jgi:endonuclease YncB( thermonuclease family)
VYRSDDGVFVNLEFAEQGCAVVAAMPPTVAHGEEFVAATRQAREAGRWLWSACEPES